MLKTLSASLMATLLAGGLPAPSGETVSQGVKITRWIPSRKGQDTFTVPQRIEHLQDGMEISDRYAGWPLVYKVEVPPGVQLTASLGGDITPKLQLFATDHWGQVKSQGLLKNRTRSVARQTALFENRESRPVKVFFSVTHDAADNAAFEKWRGRPRAIGIASTTSPDEGVPFRIRFTAQAPSGK